MQGVTNMEIRDLLVGNSLTPYRDTAAALAHRQPSDHVSELLKLDPRGLPQGAGLGLHS